MAPKNDLIFEILTRLPAKSVARFKSVCREWLGMASDPSFLDAHTRCNPLTVSGFLIQDAMRGRPISSFSIDGGASQVLTDPSLSSLDPLFYPSNGFYVSQSCNGLLLCTNFSELPSSILYLVNPTTMVYRQIPGPPTGIYPFKYQFMLAFDPFTSLHYRIACISCSTRPKVCDPGARFHIEIYSSETGAWELSRATVPGGCIIQNLVYWNGALNWVTEYGLFLSFDVEQQLVQTTPMSPRDRRGVMLYFGEARGHLHFIETVADLVIGNLDWWHFHVFKKGKNDPSWSLLYTVDLRGVRPVAAPVFFARGGKGEDDKLYLMNGENIFFYNLADRSCCNIFAMNSFITVNLDGLLSTILFSPVAHSLFSP